MFAVQATLKQRIAVKWAFLFLFCCVGTGGIWASDSSSTAVYGISLSIKTSVSLWKYCAKIDTCTPTMPCVTTSNCASLPGDSSGKVVDQIRAAQGFSVISVSMQIVLKVHCCSHTAAH